MAPPCYPVILHGLLVMLGRKGYQGRSPWLVSTRSPYDDSALSPACGGELEWGLPRALPMPLAPTLALPRKRGRGDGDSAAKQTLSKPAILRWPGSCQESSSLR